MNLKLMHYALWIIGVPEKYQTDEDILQCGKGIGLNESEAMELLKLVEEVKGMINQPRRGQGMKKGTPGKLFRHVVRRAQHFRL
jgi:hypothetical protein